MTDELQVAPHLTVEMQDLPNRTAVNANDLHIPVSKNTEVHVSYVPSAFDRCRPRLSAVLPDAILDCSIPDSQHGATALADHILERTARQQLSSHTLSPCAQYDGANVFLFGDFERLVERDSNAQ